MNRKSTKTVFPNLYVLSVILAFSAWTCEDLPAPLPPAVPTHKVLLNEGTNLAVAVSPDRHTLIIDLQGSLWKLPVEGGSAEALTDPLGGCHLPDWSPDGQQIAFHSFRDGNFHIWLIKPDGSGLRQLTRGSFDFREPNWAPNGRYIVCSSDQGGSYNLWEIDVQNGDVSQLTSFPGQETYPSYAPDGNRIAWADPDQGIFWMEKGGTPTQVSRGEGSFGAPSWTPDGASIVYCLTLNGVRQWYIVELETSQVQPLPHKPSDIFPFRVEWLSENEMLYTADGKICRKILDQEEPRIIEFQAEIPFYRKPYEREKYDFDSKLERPVMGIRSPVLSPDGTQIAFTALGDLWIQEIGGSILQLTNDSYLDIDPFWSPDGDQIVFSTDRRGKMDLWIYTLSSGRFRQLTWTDGDIMYPSWSPDGKKIACFEVNNMGLWGMGKLQIVDLLKDQINAKDVELFVPGTPIWAPGGSHLAIVALNSFSDRFREGMNQVKLVSLTTNASNFINIGKDETLSPRVKNGPVWSPDGNQIAYIQGGSLWIQGISEDFSLIGNPLRVTEELASAPNWMPDGSSLVFLAADRLKKIDLNTGKTTDIPISLNWQPEMPEDGGILIHAGKLFNGKDTLYQENIDILIRGHRIAEVIPHQPHPTDMQVINGSGQTVLPGLFDMHVHQSAVSGEQLGRRWLAYGVTSVRETGADPYDALERKESWASGKRPGPRHFFTGGLLDGSRVYYGLANSVKDTTQLKQELERARLLDYDLVKTYVRMTDANQKYAIQLAHEKGLPVYSHELYPAAAYGVDGVEHMTGTSRRGYSLKHTGIRKSYQDVRVLLVESGMTITPTMALSGGVVTYLDEHPEILRQSTYRSLFSRYFRNQFETNLNNRKRQTLETSRQLVLNQQGFLLELYRAGGKIIAGTDSPFLPEGWALHVELQLYVQSGLSPAEALITATSWAAEAVGSGKDLGTVEPGKLADLIIVDGDPLHNISDAWNIDQVIKNGRRYTIQDLIR